MANKKYFAGLYEGRIMFRATGSFVFRSLTFSKSGEWMGFASVPSVTAPVVEVSKEIYETILKLKLARIEAIVAPARVAYNAKAEAARAAGEKAPYFTYTGFGSSPTDSWIEASAAPAEVLEALSATVAA